jgi:hypothetical protein
MMFLVVAPGLPQDQVTKSLQVRDTTFVSPTQSGFDSTHFHFIEGRTILNATVPLTVVTNDPDWMLPIQLVVATSMPGATKISCRLLGTDMAVIREGALGNQSLQLLGTGETGSLDFFLNVRGTWNEVVPVSLHRVVLVYSPKQREERDTHKRELIRE